MTLKKTSWQQALDDGRYALSANRLLTDYKPLAENVRRAVELGASPEQIEAYYKDTHIEVTDQDRVKTLCYEAACHWYGEQQA